jgi:hypothetical protein
MLPTMKLVFGSYSPSVVCAAADGKGVTVRIFSVLQASS